MAADVPEECASVWKPGWISGQALLSSSPSHPIFSETAENQRDRERERECVIAYRGLGT